MSRIFISHSSVDHAAALGIAEWLEENGWGDYFLDSIPESGIAPGERWQQTLNTAAQRCEAMLFLISPAWCNSAWCIAEFLHANSGGKAIIGVVIKPTPFETLPREMTAEWQLCDLVTGTERETYSEVSFSKEGLSKLKHGLRKRGLDGLTFAWPPPHDPERAPYRGLKALESDDAAIFFGRDADIVRALNALRAILKQGREQMLVILGASGAGKSSFLRAGLWPRLKLDDRHFLPLPVIRPERGVITGDTGLAASLEAAFRERKVARSRAEIENNVKTRNGFNYLLAELEALAQKTWEPGGEPPTVIILIDQGEELGLGETELSLVVDRSGKAGSPGAEADKRTTETRTEDISNLGFDGPSLELIDPPVSVSSSVRGGKNELALRASMATRRSITGRVRAPAGLRTLTVNGEGVRPDDAGIFTASVAIATSGGDAVTMQILAIDAQNKRAAIKIVLHGSERVQVTSAARSEKLDGFGQYHALVIGNDHYQHWPELMNAISDGTAVAKLLKDRYGFQVTLLQDSTRAHIMKALNQYRKILTENDNLLIYYAGHGHLERGIDRGYWIPVDADLDDNSEWVVLTSVTDMLQLMSAKHIMVVADSCFSGKLTRSALAQLKPGLTEEERLRLLQTLAQKRVRTAMTSGGVKPVLDVGGKGHSVFAEALIGVLEENTSVLEAERLFMAVRSRVISASQSLNAEQIPTYDPIHMAGHESLGDFIFVPR